jgi:uncharacterized repeat protein (TIGR01451 family)
MKIEDDGRRLSHESSVWPGLDERGKTHLPSRVKSRTGGSARHTAKQLLFILAFLAITSISSFAATDVLFLVDTTGSMGGLSNFKTAFNGILEAIAANSACPETIMYGVADYKNYADGGNYGAYGVNLDQPFTYNTQTVSSVINGLSAGGGGDGPESQLKAIDSITNNWLTTSGDLGFNGRSGAQKIIIWAGDIFGHIAGDEPGSDGPPPAGYYPTLDAVIDALTAQGIIVFALNPSNYSSGLNQAYDGYYHQISPARQQASDITEATGGELFNNVGSGSSAIEDAIVDSIRCYSFDKDDDLNDANSLDCKTLDQELVYSISFTNDSDQTLEDAYIIDWLPSGVTYPITWSLDTSDPNNWQMISSDPNYDPNTHSYIWPLAPVAPNATVSVNLTVIVNANAEPGMYLHNVAELVVGEDIAARVTKDTLVCCWNTSGILYVDKNAPDGGSGISWETAYNDLQDALTRAGTTHCSFNWVIYVAQGTYAPQDTENGFVLPENISVYGGFPTGGCDFADRNPKLYETTLTGLIDEETIADSVVSMGEDTLLSGCTVTMALASAISGEGVDFAIEHCVVKDNFQLGINAVNGNVSVQWCKISENGTTGMYHSGVSFTLAVDNSHFMRNGEYGINCVNSTPTIKNSIVSESSLTEQGRAGIHMDNPTYVPILYNCTIANNKAQGVYFSDNADATGDPNNLDYPDLQNSIVYYNNLSGPQMTGINADLHANFCCIEDCNNVPGTTNFNDEPGFAYAVDPNGTPDPNNYHLAANSVCIDRANLFLNYTNQVDIDGEGLDRKYGAAVDVGADEVYDCSDDYLSDADVHNALDFDADGIVNLKEFAVFSAAWLTYDPNNPLCDPNNPNYVSDPNAPGYISVLDKERFNPVCDLDSDLDVDLADVMIFVDDTPWLWIACWKLEEINASMMMAMQSQSQSQSLMTESMIVENTEAMMVFPENSLVAAIESSEVDGQIAIQETPEKSVAEQIVDLQDSIEFLEQIWNQEPDIQQEINAEEWQEFMDSVRNSLLELQTETVQIE